MKLKSDIPLGDTSCSALFFKFSRVVSSCVRSGRSGDHTFLPFFIRAHVIANVVSVAKSAIPACAARTVFVTYYA